MTEDNTPAESPPAGTMAPCGTSTTPIALALGAATVLFLVMLSVIAASGQPYDTDTAHVLSHLKKDFSGFIPWFGIVLRLAVYYPAKLMHLEFDDIFPLRMIAVGITALGMLYAVWLSHRCRLLRGPYLFAFAYLYSVNHVVHTFGTWAMLTYSIDIVISTLLLHLLLHCEDMAKPLRPRAGLIVALGLLGLVLLTVRVLLPGTILVAVLALLYVMRRGISARSIGRGLGIGAVLSFPMIASGLASMWIFMHAEYLQPRDEIRHLYFGLSSYSKDLSGALHFAIDRYYGYLRDAFAPSQFLPWGEKLSGLLPLVVLLFHIGLFRSLFDYPTVRFRIGLYVATTLLALLVMGLLGLYAFGDPRYALFLHVPVLLVAILGLSDVAESAKSVLARRTALASAAVNGDRKAPRRILAGGMALLLLVQFGMALNTLRASDDYQERWRSGMQRVQSSPADLAVVFDQNVWYAGMYFRALLHPNASRDSFAVHMNEPREQGTFEKFLLEHSRFYSVTSAPFDAAGYPESAGVALAQGFKEVPRVVLGRWYLGRAWYFSEWVSRDRNLLGSQDPYPETPWRLQGEALVVPEPYELGGRGEIITLGPGASVSQTDGLPVAPGDLATGNTLLSPPEQTALAVILEGQGGDGYEAVYTMLAPDAIPRNYTVANAFRLQHDSATLRIVNLGATSASLSSQGAELFRAGAPSGSARGPSPEWRSVGATAMAMPEPSSEESSTKVLRCLTGTGRWDGIVYVCPMAEGGEEGLTPCTPDTPYEVSLKLRGIQRYEGEMLHMMVTDQDANRLCAPKIAPGAEFTEHRAQFKTLAGSKYLRIEIVKAKSPQQIEFEVTGMQIHPSLP